MRLIIAAAASIALLAACESPSDSGRPGAPTRMVVFGDLQVDTAGQQLPEPVAIRLLDARRGGV